MIKADPENALWRDPHTASFLPLFALLYPFPLSIWSIGLITDFELKGFARVLARGALISGIVSRHSAVLIGTITVEMTFNGLGSWLRTTTPTRKRAPRPSAAPHGCDPCVSRRAFRARVP